MSDARSPSAPAPPPDPSSDSRPDAGGAAPPPPTEATHPASRGIDALDARGIVGILHGEDGAVSAALGAALDAIARVVDDVVERLRAGGRLIYIGAGTSGRLGVLDASECPPTFGVAEDLVVGIIAGGDAALRRSIEGAEDDPAAGAAALAAADVGPADFVCGIAASGTTPYVLGALAEGRRRGAATALLTCNPLAAERRAELGLTHAIELVVGPEVIAGSTRLKAGTATKLALNMISTAAMVRLGKVHDNRMVDLRPVNAKLRRRAAALVAEIGGVHPERAAALLQAAGFDVKVAIVMARGGLAAAAARKRLEAAQGRLRAALESSGGTS